MVIDDLETEVENALNFDALVCRAKARADLKILETKRARQNRIASMRDRIHAELEERQENGAKYLENKTSNANHNHDVENYESRYTIKMNLREITPIETGRLESTPEKTECDSVTDHNRVSEQRTMIPITFGHPINDPTNTDLNSNLTQEKPDCSCGAAPKVTSDRECKSEDHGVLDADSYVEYGKRNLLQSDVPRPLVLHHVAQERKRCKENNKNCEEKKFKD